MIRLVEVGPRDGLQNEAALIPTDAKVAFVDRLSESGLLEIEAGAFVSPKWVPQLADSAAVFARIRRVPGVVYSALVPNLQGLEGALEARADKIAVFTAASETFNRKNINASIDESFERLRPVVERARSLKLPVRGYVSTAFWCPYEGKIDPVRAVEVCRRLADLGVDEVSVGDTIGKARPADVAALLAALMPVVPAGRIALHFHDTYHHAIANVLEGVRLGIRAFDASVGGLGGCPYAPGAGGNAATEAVIEGLRGAGERVEVDLAVLARARRELDPFLARG